MRRLFALAVMAAALSAAPSDAAGPHPALTASQRASIDAFVTAEMKRERVPGVAVGVYSRGTVLLAKGYGLANVELSVPVKPETLFQSGSVGKQFVSTAVMMLVEDGKLSLDDSITKYFPDAPATWKPILIKNLLSHTSGLSEYETPDRMKAGGPFYLRNDYTEDELVKNAAVLPIESPPGDKWNYRNTNYLLLGILIHRVTGMPYADFLAGRVFKPLGMTATRIISESDIIPNRAAGYQIRGTELKNQEWVSPTFNSTGDGTLYFNVLDLAKWDAALYTTKLLKQSSLDRIWTVFALNDGKPNPAGYGFAWSIANQNGHKLIEHGGAWQGFTCQISRYPDDSLTVVVLTNLDAGHARPAVFAHVIAGLADAPLLPPRLTAIDDAQPAIAASLRSLLDRIAAGHDIREQVTPEFATLITPQSTQEVQQRVAAVWPGGTLTLVRRVPVPNDPTRTLSTYRLTKRDQALLIVYSLNAEGKVAGLGFQPDREYL
jgi:CubicO group peptidase (beta-lactamase class C family)